MKTLVLLCVVFLTVKSYPDESVKNAVVVERKLSKETRNLLAGLKTLAQKGIMFGHQDDGSYGIGWIYPKGESDVKKVCSDFPALTGMDLGHIENKSMLNLDSVPFEDMRAIARNVYSRGGILTFSWHSDNPLTGGSAWDVSSAKVVSSVLPGGEKNEKYKQWLDCIALFFNNLTDKDGQLIPVIFRPYHEHTGSWFWWGKKLCTPQEFIGLWQYTVNYLCNTKHVQNLLFAYSSSGDITNKEEFLERYPGDSFVDLIGFDYYQSAPSAGIGYIEDVRKKLAIISTVADEHKKVFALTETGLESIPDPSWWTGVLWPAIKDFKISYVMVWRNAHNKPGHYFAPYPGQVSERDFINFYNLPETLFQKEISQPKIYR
jgi:mannan endo-1,4-beta-mannosidase